MQRIELSKIILLMAAFVGLHSAQAYIGFGNIVTNTAKYQIDKKAHRSYFSLGPYVALNHNFKIESLKHEVIPEVGLAVHSKPSPNHSRTTYFFLLPLAWELLQQHYFRYGLGTLITGISGPGGTTVLENGTRFTEFYRPGKPRYAKNGALILGYEYRFHDGKFGIRWDFLSVAFLSKNRTLGYTASFNVYYF